MLLIEFGFDTQHGNSYGMFKILLNLFIFKNLSLNEIIFNKRILKNMLTKV